ncbi:helix-turn-helix transcriptional regulator [Paenibacillus sp. y28]|uniref:helix-turn-helix transcriptional regulator n=1 Tax=Paenibacillus sp. y28 TaxID=3129110 RepID=UPI0030164F09
MKLDRLLAITMLLLNRKRVSAAELSERFEVSLRTVYRDLDTLSQAGIPVVSHAGAAGGYEIMEQYRIERQFLSLDELQSIIIALRGIQSTFKDQDISSLMDKVGTLVARSEQQTVQQMKEQLVIDLNPWHGGQEEKEKLAALREAIGRTQIVQFAYTSSQGDDSVRSCEPMGVVLKGYIWYLCGFCRLRQDYRIFRLTRIDRLEVLPETFERRDKSLEQLSYGWGGPAAASANIRLVLRFHSRRKARIRDDFQADQIKVEPDGSLLVTASQPEEPWLYSMLLSYGADVTIIEPESVARAVCAEAKKLIGLYPEY